MPLLVIICFEFFTHHKLDLFAIKVEFNINLSYSTIHNRTVL